MNSIAQFVYSYTDQFTKSQWVNWSEGPLSKIPEEKFQNKKGFQRALNSTDSTDRTRAGEAYRLGFLKGPIIDGRFEVRHDVPLGWAKVISGNFPHSRLGMYAYLIGKAMQNGKGIELFKAALDSLATVQILHVGFKIKDHWFCTVAFFEFARRELISLIKRDLNDDELRYLAGAVFNTIDEGGFANFLSSMIGDRKFESLFFSLRNGKTYNFNLVDFEKLVARKDININDIKNHKAALFWASTPRGLYSRAASGDGKSFLSNFLDSEIFLYKSGRGSAMSEIYDSIARGEIVKDIFDLARVTFSISDLLDEDWYHLVTRLNNATRLCVEKIDFSSAPQIWKFSQRYIFSKPEIEITQSKVDEFDDSDDIKKSGLAVHKDGSKSPGALPTNAEIKSMLKKQNKLFCDVPAIDKKIKSQASNSRKRNSNIDYLEQSKRDLSLGKSGEEFVYELEINKLKEAGKEHLANKVLWVSKEIGDGVGYDILSFNENEKHMFIEVKTTKKGPKNPFYLSSNELEVSLEKRADYHIYRLFNYPLKPNIYIVQGPLNDTLDLTPTNYIALPISHEP